MKPARLSLYSFGVSLESIDDAPNRFALTAEDSSLVEVLGFIENEIGLSIKGRRHLKDRSINGQFQGPLEDILGKLLKYEQYILVWGPSIAITPETHPIEKIIFLGQSNHYVEQAVDEPFKPHQNAEKTAPPIDPRVLKAISPPPANTPERRRFDEALNRVQETLDRQLAPLKSLSR